MSHKLIFFDIDGTLWDNTNYIPPSTSEAIRLLKAAGHRVFINSGRTRGYIFHPDLLALDFDGIVSGCGTMIEMGDRTVFRRDIPGDLLLETMEYLKSIDVYSILEGPEYLYFDDYFKSDPYGRKVIRDMGSMARGIREEWGRWTAEKFSCVTIGTDMEAMHSKLDPHFYFMSHTPEIHELVPVGFDKGTGIKKVCELLGADISETIAFGDSVNDREMMDAAGFSVAMGNGTDELKKTVDFVTTDLHDGGIMNACKALGLI